MKRFAVIGLSSFGFHVAKTLFEEGHDVFTIDINKDRAQRMQEFSSEAIVMDATDKERLKTLGLESMDCVIVSTGIKISTSVLISLHLQEIGVKNILAKAVDEDHGEILKRVGATEVVYPEKDMAVRTAKNLSTLNILDFIPLEEDYSIVQISSPGDFVGKSLAELKLRSKYNIHVIAIKELVPEKFVLVPPAGTVIKDSDILIIIGKSEDITKIRELT